MKRKWLIVGLFCLFILFSGCASIQREIKDTKSDWAGGLDRVITVYDENGKVIKTYSGKIDLDPDTTGGKVKFELNGKRIIIYNATIIVEEK